MVEGDTFDGGELALATFLQAKEQDVPLSLLPAVMGGANHHRSITYNAEFGEIIPRDIEGRRVAVRSYSQTTGVWVRGFLCEDFGVDLDRVTWVCASGPHVAGCAEPANVERVPTDTNLGQMLLSGEVSALIVGVEALPKGGELRPLIPLPNEAACKWSERHHGVPINHMFVLRSDLVKNRPDVVEEVYRMLSQAKAMAQPDGKSEFIRFGIGANASVIDLFCKLCRDQHIVRTNFDADALFQDARKILRDAS
ncbi:phosphate ABC transporter substrate-binding protein [Novosphingobium mathurense]|uniref:4,5-dihydroxyphthalate decarboxylase n=1 Tax=Novosphingobium mathurense TaxID=428990 RepID=A0A1U6ILU7_9SPHN|nr:phosphate ABC transporter substrate-binding protein [Novosphingobium mathurense]SLK09008.1 4,5-dihydroxyphthalate decarboxylase [Novosphingobium mathurense]